MPALEYAGSFRLTIKWQQGELCLAYVQTVPAILCNGAHFGLVCA